MLDAHAKGDHIMIYSRPGAWADIEVSVVSTTDTGDPIELAELDIKVTYDWSTRATDTRLAVRVGGAFSARSPLLEHGQSARLETEVLCESGTVMFTYRNSSEYCGNVLCDGLVFFIDDTEMAHFTGETGVQSATFDVTAGLHTFAWEYSKDATDSAGDDRAAIDDIWFPAILSALDSDNDGMPDSFETEHDLNPFLDDSLDDKDGDGFSNGDEYDAGTSPSGPDDRPFEPGDANLDGKVDLLDAGLCLRLLTGKACDGIGLGGADANGNGVVDMEDIVLILKEVAEGD